MALVQQQAKKDVEIIDGVFTVYSVDAADRFALFEVKDGEPVFHQVMLAFIQAPKLGRRQAGGELAPDDACGFDAMEFVRAMTIGRQVHFRGAFYVEPLKRFAGQMLLQDGTDVSVALLKAGLATIPGRIPDKMPKPHYDEYVQLQTSAKQAKKGLFAPGAKENRIREVLPHPPEAEFGEAITGRSMKVRVDRVASGSGLLLHVGNPTDDMAFQAVQAAMTGIQCPHMYQKDGSIDPLGQAAKAHTERLLLHRNITVRFEGVDANGNYLITISGAKGSTFQEELLSNGFASINAATVSKTGDAARLQAAEKAAQANNVGMWGSGPINTLAGAGAAAAAGTAGAAAPVVIVTSGPTPKADPAADGSAAAAPAKPLPAYNGAAAFDGTVVQVINGDTIVVRNAVTKEYTRVSLAGVKAPKVSNRDGEQRNGPRPPESRVSHEGYTWEAREFLRSTCIGQRVKVRVEYARVMEGDAKEVRAMATVIDADSGTNVGAALLRSGFARFFLGRSDVCSCAEELRVAEATAAEAKRGLHNTGVIPPSVKMTELNRIGEKQGKHYLSFFQRGMQGKRPPNMTAIVEQVMSGSSFRVYVPREHCIFTIRLAGIVTPSNFGESNDPFAEESKDFAVVALQQREVEIQVEAVDKGGAFIGYLSIRGKNFALTILSEGLATVSNPERCLNPTELVQAEAVAKAAKKNIWSDKGAVPAMAQKRAAQQASRNAVKATYTKAKGEWFPVNVTNIDDSVNLHIVPQTAANDAVRATMAPLIASIGADAAAKRHAPAKGETVVVLFKEDGQWYRGKVVELYASEKRADVHFLDFGNVQDVAFKDIRQIPSDSSFDVLRNTEPLAVPVRLSYIKNREDTDEFLDAVVACGWEYVGSPSEVLQASVDYTSDNGNVKYYTIATKVGAASLQEKLLQSGLGLVERRTVTVDPAEVTKHLKQQDYARSRHVGMWIHGDFDDDDDDQ